MIGSSLVLRTVAGNGNAAPQAVDGQPATSQAIGSPNGLAVDSSGTFYFGGVGGRTYGVDATGILRLVAGGSLDNLASGDLGPALAGRILFSFGLAVDEDAGLLYISDPRENRVRKVRLLPAGRSPCAQSREDRLQPARPWLGHLRRQRGHDRSGERHPWLRRQPDGS